MYDAGCKQNRKLEKYGLETLPQTSQRTFRIWERIDSRSQNH